MRQVPNKLNNVPASKEAASPEKIREALNSMAFDEIEIEQKLFYVKTKETELSTKLPPAKAC